MENIQNIEEKLAKWTGSWCLKESQNYEPFLRLNGVPEDNLEKASKAPDYHQYIFTKEGFKMYHHIPATGLELNYFAKIGSEIVTCPYVKLSAELHSEEGKNKPVDIGKWHHWWEEGKEGVKFWTEIFQSSGRVLKFSRELIDDDNMTGYIQLWEGGVCLFDGGLRFFVKESGNTPKLNC